VTGQNRQSNTFLNGHISEPEADGKLVGECLGLHPDIHLCMPAEIDRQVEHILPPVPHRTGARGITSF